ncbi:prtD protein [Asticcacaulis biprosthecium C19]|uniref:PrtD protein n=1 Tax=Asticcacaulis biprosthecium C19 TaxID=715226 RepID=F4QHG0_9CAUL|nr:type I secretion system permease/ATPase [Asticcacaulis biprosthecium]EGF92697.1 prtD protein [Asticcacaulis biprosthecium C19]
MISSLFRIKINPVMADAIKQCRPHFINAAVFSFFINMLSLAPTLYMLQVYGRVVSTGSMTTLIYITLMLIVSLIALSFLDSVRSRLLMRSGMRLDKVLVGNVLNHLYARIGNGRQATNAGLLREFDTFKQTLSGQGMVALFDLPWIFLFVGLCFILHPVLGWMTVGGGVALGIITWLSERASYRYITQAAENMQKAYTRQEATTQRADVVRALGMRRALVNQQLEERHSALDDQVKANLSVGGYTTSSKFLRQLLQSISLGVGAYLAVQQEISAGAIFAASLLMARALMPMEQVISNWRSLIRGYNAFRTIDKALAEDATKAVTSLPRPKAVLEVEGLSIVHAEQKAYILQNITFRVGPGEMLGIAGVSGAGKSTLARVLVGCDGYEIGAIRVDGAERKDWDPEVLAKYIGYLPQDPTLFPGTVRDNICRFESGDSDEIDELVIAAAKLAGVHDMVLQLSNGYNTLLNMNGQGLSGGQAQRVALARALYRDPPILVLDEPNAYQDQAGEIALINAMNGVCARGGAVIVIAHRAMVLDRVTRLMMLANGRVAFLGTPAQYAEAMKKQQASNATPTSLAPITGGKAAN